MKKEDLIALGFIDRSFDYEGEHFSEYRLTAYEFTIEISGLNHVEFGIEGNYIHVQKCDTIEDLKTLLKLLGI